MASGTLFSIWWYRKHPGAHSAAALARLGFGALVLAKKSAEVPLLCTRFHQKLRGIIATKCCPCSATALPTQLCGDLVIYLRCRCGCGRCHGVIPSSPISCSLGCPSTDLVLLLGRQGALPQVLVVVGVVCWRGRTMSRLGVFHDVIVIGDLRLHVGIAKEKGRVLRSEEG